jgi:hypothetical protein
MLEQPRDEPSAAIANVGRQLHAERPRLAVGAAGRRHRIVSMFVSIIRCMRSKPKRASSPGIAFAHGEQTGKVISPRARVPISARVLAGLRVQMAQRWPGASGAMIGSAVALLLVLADR